MAGFMGGQFSIDRDGTCTDIVVRDGEAGIIARISLSDPRGQYHETAISASRRTLAPFGRDGAPGNCFSHS
jgi:N-methylhydantoinase A/oxoprolinase/acetone carboxylase beta subunit